MDFILMFKAAILGVVEGLTEFLPVSSTGHLILTRSALGLSGEFWESFEVAIQFGAIIAVMWEFRERITQVIHGLVRKDSTSWRFVANMMIATIPALVIYKLFSAPIKFIFFTPLSVAIALIVGGLVILWAEKIHSQKKPVIVDMNQLSCADALKIGLAQTLAVIFPGTSRSGATIIGGMFFGLSRQAATHFSFFLAMPILFLAFIKGVWDMRHLDTVIMNEAVMSHGDMMLLFFIGFVSALLSAFVCVRWLLKFVSSHNFIGFAWYRIALGVFILLSAKMGFLVWS